MPVIDHNYEQLVEDFRDFDVKLLYALLYPLIQEDFMGKKDCRNIHSSTNMQALVGEETGSINHIVFQGGDDTQASSKKRDYERQVRDGDNRLDQSHESSEF